MSTEECKKFKTDLAHVARLSLSDKVDDLRLYVAKLVRHYRDSEPALSEELAAFLRNNAPKSAPSMMRRMAPEATQTPNVIPFDDDSKLTLLKKFTSELSPQKPILSEEIENVLDSLIKERKLIDKLARHGLEPTKSAVFVGEPGIGKTITAKWIAAQLDVPLFVLDLSAVMSSLLGRSGANLRSALDFAKQTPCVLLLDELDAIAKRRSDDSDIGELKRLVTVILQEVDEWPSSGLLLAATNHPELIDPALWRRFDLVVQFEFPDASAVSTAIKRFLGTDLPHFEKWLTVLTYSCQKESFSDIERLIKRLRRNLVIGGTTAENLVSDWVKVKCNSLDRQAQIEFAVILDSITTLSQRRVSEITGVSRDTIRKHRPLAGAESKRSPRMSKDT